MRLVRPPPASSQTVTPLPAARPSALTTKPAPPRARSVAKATAGLGLASKAPACAIRTPAAAATSWQNALLDSIRAAGARRAEDGDPGLARARRRRPAASGASGPDDDELDGVGAGQRRRRLAVERIDAGTHRTRGSVAIAGAARARR